VGTSLAVSAAATAALALARPAAVVIPAALVLGLASGIPFATAFGAAAHARPDAPAAAMAMVNMAANATIVVGTPLAGLAFLLPGDGRILFVALAVLWLCALLALPPAPRLRVR
jgi:predicted MFS family arabinose efflux permease